AGQGPSTSSALHTTTSSRRDKAGRYDQALQLYTNAIEDADLLAKLSVRGLDEAVLQAGAAAVTAIQKAVRCVGRPLGNALPNMQTRSRQELVECFVRPVDRHRSVVPMPKRSRRRVRT